MQDQMLFGSPVIIVCRCGCHMPGVAMLHITACCQGWCPKCGLYFKSGKQAHVKSCDGSKPEPVGSGGLVTTLPE